ncbi:MAG: hypothetical protein JO276_06560 [Sphingomonadaceae bacterium]|nr:hypothetical protein [Sphingomonadaceae bacterium]
MVGGSSTRRGEASERIIHALADEFPNLHNRQSFLRSPSLRQRFGKGAGESLSENEEKAAAKTLGRLIGDKIDASKTAISEFLWLRGEDERVALPALGLVAVSVDIVTLREEEWLRTQLVNRKTKDSGLPVRGPTLPPDRSPSQEGIVEEIIDRSREWIKSNSVGGQLPVMLTNVSIIHGSISFDILVNVSFKEQDNLLRYAREVVQRIPHIRGTQTMLVSHGYGFSNV